MAAQTGCMLYFAYGEDLSRAGFERLFPGSEWLGLARLEGYRVVPNSVGRANLRVEEGSTVWGVLWMVPAALLPALDANAGAGYQRTTRRIVSPAALRIEATLYLSTERGRGASTLIQLETVLAGARENRLPAEYIAELKSAGKPRKDSH